MNNKEIAENLKGLVKLYEDCAWNYERALALIQDEELHQQLIEMSDSHLERMRNLKEYIKQLGVAEADYIEEMSAEISIVNDEMADEDIVKVLKKNENLLSRELQGVVETVQIPELVQDLEDEIEDEKIYIDTLDNFLS